MVTPHSGRNITLLWSHTQTFYEKSNELKETFLTSLDSSWLVQPPWNPYGNTLYVQQSKEEFPPKTSPPEIHTEAHEKYTTFFENPKKNYIISLLRKEYFSQETQRIIVPQNLLM